MTKERFEISCPGCNQQYEVDDTRLGTELACHGCGETFVISDEMLQTIDADSPDEMHHEKVEDDSEPITKNRERLKSGRSWVLNTAVVLCFAVQCVILFYVKEHNEMNAEIGNKITNLEIKLNSVSSDVFTISLNTRELPKARVPVDRFRVTTDDIASQLGHVEGKIDSVERKIDSVDFDLRNKIESRLTDIGFKLNSIESEVNFIRFR